GCRRPTVGRADTSAARRPGTRWGPVPPGCRPAAPPRSVDVEHELGADLELGTAVDLPQRRDHLAGVAVGRDLGGDPPQRVARADDVALPLPRRTPVGDLGAAVDPAGLALAQIGRAHGCTPVT